MDRDTNQSKGFGFVELTTEDEAQAAITALNGKEHSGKALKVNEAKPKSPRTAPAGAPAMAGIANSPW